MILYCVLVTTSQNQPVAELYQSINLDKGLFSVIVEKELNRLPEKR